VTDRTEGELVSAELDLDTPASGPVHVTVYDPLGRRVRTLASSVRVADHHELVWDGQTDGGTLAAPGVYIVLAEMENARTRLTLVR